MVHSPKWLAGALTLLAMAVAFLPGCTPPPAVPTAPKPEDPVELRAVNVKQLDEEIAQHRGKVVLIDAWFLGCAPCVKRFPKFVEMHRELRAEGLVCISLNVYPEENKIRDKVLAFLKEKDANTINLIVQDDAKALDAWQEKHQAVATPSYAIFDRKGNRVPTPEPEDKETISAALKKLLAEK